jgi:hypothetical protein
VRRRESVGEDASVKLDMVGIQLVCFVAKAKDARDVRSSVAAASSVKSVYVGTGCTSGILVQIQDGIF